MFTIRRPSLPTSAKSAVVSVSDDTSGGALGLPLVDRLTGAVVNACLGSGGGSGGWVGIDTTRPIKVSNSSRVKGSFVSFR